MRYDRGRGSLVRHAAYIVPPSWLAPPDRGRLGSGDTGRRYHTGPPVTGRGYTARWFGLPGRTQAPAVHFVGA